MVIDNSDESSNGSLPASSSKPNQCEHVKHHNWGQVVINLVTEPRPSFLGTDASDPSQQSTLIDLDWAHKESQHEKEEWWAREWEQMKDERDEAVQCAEENSKVENE